MSSPRLKVAVFGAGWVANHRHLPALVSNEWVDVVGVVDRHAERAEAAARKFSIPRWAAEENPERVAWLDGVDAATVATPPQTHHAVAGGLLRRGIHVLCEKPLAMTVAQGEDLCELARSGTVLAVVHNFQFSRAFARLFADLESGRLGPPRAFEGFQLSNPRRRLPVWYEKLPGGLFFDESPHLIYLLRRLGGGRLLLQSAFAARSGNGSSTPDLLTANLVAGDGVPARLTLNFVAPVSEWQIVVCGNERLGAADIFRDIAIDLPNDGKHRTGTVLRTSLRATIGHWGGHVLPGSRHLMGRHWYGNDEVVRRFVDACLHRSTPEGIAADDGLAVLRLQHQILSAAGFA